MLIKFEIALISDEVVETEFVEWKHPVVPVAGDLLNSGDLLNMGTFQENEAHDLEHIANYVVVKRFLHLDDIDHEQPTVVLLLAPHLL